MKYVTLKLKPKFILHKIHLDYSGYDLCVVVTNGTFGKLYRELYNLKKDTSESKM